MGEVVDITSNLPHEFYESICMKCLDRVITVSLVGCLLKDLECGKCHSVGFLIKTGQGMEGLND